MPGYQERHVQQMLGYPCENIMYLNHQRVFMKLVHSITKEL